MIPPKAPPAVPAAPLTGMAATLMAIVSELTAVMEMEIPLIKERDYAKQGLLIRRKQELTQDYQNAMKAIADNPSLLAGLTPQQKATLKESGKKLDEVSQRNAEAIRLAHIATEHFLKAIMEEVRKDMHRNSGYSGRGMLAMAEAVRAQPVAINQRI